MSDTLPPQKLDPAALAERRAAVADLGSAMRAATVAIAMSEVGVDELAEATELAKRISQTAGRVQRPQMRIPVVDDVSGGIRYMSPVTGLGTPISPPILFDVDGDDVLVRIVFDGRFEGPPGFVHGGITSLVFDEVLGQAANRIDRWGMTVELTTTYRRALPLGVELEFRSRVVSVEGRKTFVRGTAVVAARPDEVCVEAHGIFVEPRASKQQEYFADLTDASGAAISVRHGFAGAHD